MVAYISENYASDKVICLSQSQYGDVPGEKGSGERARNLTISG